MHFAPKSTDFGGFQNGKWVAFSNRCRNPWNRTISWIFEITKSPYVTAQKGEYRVWDQRVPPLDPLFFRPFFGTNISIFFQNRGFWISRAIYLPTHDLEWPIWWVIRDGQIHFIIHFWKWWSKKRSCTEFYRFGRFWRPDSAIKCLFPWFFDNFTFFRRHANFAKTSKCWKHPYFCEGTETLFLTVFIFHWAFRTGNAGFGGSGS